MKRSRLAFGWGCTSTSLAGFPAVLLTITLAGADGCPPPLDADADGFTTDTDCDDTDATIFPGADEVCEDGIDQDCDGVDPDCPPCPPEMVLIETFCIDRWEAYIVDWSPYEVPSGGVATAAAGAVPQGYISEVVAEDACEAAGKRLCDLEEWMRACQGPQGWTYPYGNSYVEGACNDTYPGTHPVVDYYGTSTGVWDTQHMNDPGINQQPDTVDPSGANPNCVSYDGVYDMHGNLHEWIADPAGTFKGGFYADASTNGAGCYYTTTAHDIYYYDYSTGFRCCADPDFGP